MIYRAWTVECDTHAQVRESSWSHNLADGPLARYVKLRVAHAPGMPGTFSPPLRVSDPDMHYGTCVMHAGIANWRFPLKSDTGKKFPAFPAHAQFYVSGKRPMCNRLLEHPIEYAPGFVLKSWLANRLFNQNRAAKKEHQCSILLVPSEGNPRASNEFPFQRSIGAKNIFMPWRDHPNDSIYHGAATLQWSQRGVLRTPERCPVIFAIVSWSFQVESFTELLITRPTAHKICFFITKVR